LYLEVVSFYKLNIAILSLSVSSASVIVVSCNHCATNTPRGSDPVDYKVYKNIVVAHRGTRQSIEFLTGRIAQNQVRPIRAVSAFYDAAGATILSHHQVN
jgi:hypothetical protein